MIVVTSRPGPGPAWLAEHQRQTAEIRHELAQVRQTIIEQLGGHDAGWALADRFDSLKNDMLDLLADHFPSLAPAILGLAPHILERRMDGEWTCCSSIRRA